MSNQFLRQDVMLADITRVLQMYPSLDGSLLHDDAQLTPLAGAGGFSGALFWKLRSQGRDFCIRRWPDEHPSELHLQWIHDALAHIYLNGCQFVPVPIADREGRTFQRHGGHLWEVSSWMPGRADFRETLDDETRRTKLVNAVIALALWHKAAATFPDKRPSVEVRRVEIGHSAPGIEMRRRRYEELRNGGIEALRRQLMRHDTLHHDRPLPSEIVITANALVREFSRSRDFTSELRAACQHSVTLQPCMRDIWHDHVLFVNDEVSGFVDFGAMRLATVEGDVARLLGSLVGDDQRLWEMGLETYQLLHPQSDRELATRWQLVRTWDTANLLLAGLQWVQWLFVDGRQFQSYETVHKRMEDYLLRLRKWNLQPHE